MFVVGAVPYRFHKHVRLCELVKASLTLQLCQGLHFYPYDLTRTTPPLQVVFYARPNAEPGVLEVLRQENASHVSLYQVLQHGMWIR